MKNLFRFLMAVAILFTASCAKEDISTSLVGNGETVEVTFSANLADLGTRAYGDGTQVNTLRYYVYDEAFNELTALCKKAKAENVVSDFDNFKATVRLQLVKGMTYNILFWADNGSGIYSINNGVVSFDAKDEAENVIIDANDESRDAFFGVKSNFTVGQETDVILKRPFAQLNVIVPNMNEVDDSINLANDTIQSWISTKICTSFDPFYGETGKAGNETEAVVELNKKDVPNVNNGHLSMNYLLPPGHVVDVTFSFKSAKFKTSTEIKSIPLKANYKTNVIGNLLTSSTDFQVEIKPGFLGDEANIYTGNMSEQIVISENGYYIFDNLTLSVESGAAVSIAEGLDNVKIGLKGNVYIESANGSGIGIGAGSKLTLNGGNLTAKGNGNHAFGIGGNGATVTLDGVTVDYACGGHIQPLFVNDTSYGKSEPEGGAAIGGAEVNILNSTITKVDGGSKAAAIGAQYWQSAVINIKNSTILEANGGNASAGIGGSRYGSDSKYNLEINIVKSTITATGGQGGAGIGSGYDTHCNGQNYTATNKITIDAKSIVNATGGKYAAGIGTGFHSAYLSGEIKDGAKITAASGEKVYKNTYTTAQDIGYGVMDPAREFSGNNAKVTFTVNGKLITHPNPYTAVKVGNTEYNINQIDEAIAAWTNNTTLTLLADVTLNNVVTLKSTEYHILDLGIYTLTAAKGKDAISITAEGRTSASYALDIKADATNPGGITATSKAVVKTTGKSGVKDRPIIRFYNGVFNASNVISHSGSNGTNCPQFWFYGGVYNANLSANRALIQINGGTFNGKFYTSVDSSAYALISGGKFKYLDNLYGSALNSDKFTIGSSKGNFDRGVYVDDEGYFVVGGPAITEFGDKFAAKATNASKAGSYLPYSSAATNGLYYTNAAMAIAKHGEANVVLK